MGRKLTGGRTIGVNPDRAQLPLYGDSPKGRVGAPGTWSGNVATGTQLLRCAQAKLAQPDLSWVKVVIRDMGGELFLVVAPARPPVDPQKPEPDTYPLRFHSEAKAPSVRGLKLLFENSGIELRDDLWYEFATEIAEDDALGSVVCGSWTKATTRPRSDGEDEAAAAKQ